METIMLISRLLHSWTRWIFLVVAVVALVIFVLGLIQKRPWTQNASRLLNAYSSILSLQWVFGLVLLIAYGSLTNFSQRHLWEHLFVQTLAVVVANAHHGWRRRELSDAVRWRNGLIVIVVSLLLGLVGVFALPVAIQWRFFVP